MNNIQLDVEKLRRQVELEEEAVDLGVAYYQKLKERSELSELPPGMRLLMNAMHPMIDALAEFKRSNLSTGRLASTRKFLQQLPNEEIAYMTAQRCINALSSIEPLQRIAINIANNLHDHIEYKRFKEAEPRYLYKVEQNLKTSNAEHRRVVILRAKRKLGIEDINWTDTDKVHVGLKCIDLFITSTGLVEKAGGQYQQAFILQPSPRVVEWLEKQHAKCELLNPVYLPMIMSPKKWSSCYDGGFLCNEITVRQKLVKTRNNAVLAELNNSDMSEVYSAVNAAQETPWRINKRVYEVMKQIWESNDNLGDLPAREDKPLPVRPWNTDEEFAQLKVNNPEAVKKWKIEATKIYTHRIKSRSSRYAMLQKLWVAEKFLNEEEIFFCWTLDWRGRMYPVQSFVNPQADDSGKALIEFAKGMPLGDGGSYWLCVHLANCFGFDKASFDDRVQWVVDNHKAIMDSVDNPLDGERFWCEADDPFQFLAAAFEYAGWYKEGDSFVSHIPVGMDGSCNGLQNFSAMLKDEIGGAQVNLIPSEKPADVYTAVAQRVSANVEKDAESGNEMAKLWVGKIDRKIAKRNVMTYVYGAKKYGFKYQLMAELEKRNTTGVKYLNTDNDDFAPATYLAGKMYEGIGEVVVAAKNAMDWLQEVARITAKSERPLLWVTPVGFRPFQNYLKTRSKQIETFWGGIRLQVRLELDTDKLNKVKQANGISPNFVHSLDAAHLMRTINMCLDEGITDFSMIHDSYGTHAANIDNLARILREAFIIQYSEDVLENFKKEVEEQLSDELRKEIPPLPRKGNLDLQAVRDSKYFFA